MKNKIARYISILFIGLVVSSHIACEDDFEKDLKIRSFFQVHEGNKDDIYFMDEPIQFYNYSLHGTTYLWDFDDGTPTSSEKEPIHVFDREGKFGVSLKVFNGTDEAEYIDTLTIVVNPG